MSQLFPSGGQSIGVSALASVLLMNIPDWFPLELTGLISLQSKAAVGVGEGPHLWVPLPLPSSLREAGTRFQSNT